MTYTHEDALTKQWLPAVRAMRPAGQVLQGKAVARAITEDGYVDPIALLPGGANLDGHESASTTLSSSDTVTPVAYMTTVIHLTEGVWYLHASGGVTGRLSGSSNLNAYIDLNGQRSSNYQVPLAAGDTGVAWPEMILTEVSGDVQLDLLIRPSAGTLTIEAGFWDYKARRVR